jgi:hypothetical protein
MGIKERKKKKKKKKRRTKTQILVSAGMPSSYIPTFCVYIYVLSLLMLLLCSSHTYKKKRIFFLYKTQIFLFLPCVLLDWFF